ncbi:MAG TPA: enoyl-CoA hydratase/isomerase family protein [Spirochaetota bacterium]|nr:enoyl-CoA hydratase/isomerase family protein [Spirochaetota bacterium]
MRKEPFIDYSVRDDIGIMSMDNGPHNYISRPDFIDVSAMRHWITDNRLKGIIITGKGNHFSAGADLAALEKLARDPDQLLSKMKQGKEILAYLESLDIPVLAAIRGACFGGGLEIALSAHLRVAGETALFSFPETGLGLIPGLGGTVRLAGVSGRGAATEMILSGDIINAQKARELNIIDYITPKKQVMEFSLNLLKKMVEKRPLEIINAVMRSVRNAGTMGFAEAMDEESRLFCRLAVKKFKADEGA